MGTLMEFAGGMPRNLPGPRELMANGAGPDHIAREIEAALARLEHRGERGQLLVKLASLRQLCVNSTGLKMALPELSVRG